MSKSEDFQFCGVHEQQITRLRADVETYKGYHQTVLGKYEELFDEAERLEREVERLQKLDQANIDLITSLGAQLLERNAQLEVVQQEMTQLTHPAKDFPTWKSLSLSFRADKVSLEARCARLEKFVAHKVGCTRLMTYVTPDYNVQGCSCGLEAALAEGQR